MTDWKERCSELADRLDDALTYTVGSDTERSMRLLISRTRAALAQPEPETSRLRYCDVHGQQPENAWGCPECVREMRHQLAQPKPEGPSDEELDYLWAEIDGGPDCCAWRPYARAVLARFGRPAIEPNDGEIDEEAAKVIPWLLEEAAQAADADQPYAAGKLTLAAQLLGEYRPAIKPVPVSTEAAFAMGQTGGPPSEAERLAFEAWMRGHSWLVAGRWNGITYADPQEHYSSVDVPAMQTRMLWAAWRDRSALGRPAIEPVPVAERLPGPEDCDSEGLLHLAENGLNALRNQVISSQDDYDAIFVALTRLASLSRPAIKPVPATERLPGPEDCDAEGRCWAWNPEAFWWDLCQLKFIKMNAGDPFTHWLPHYALPVPTPQLRTETPPQPPPCP